MIVSGLVAYHPDLEPLMVPIDDIQQHPQNYNNGDLDAIAESIEVNGMYRPIFVQKTTRYIVAGNHTWAACKMLDATDIPVIWLDVSDQAAKKILLADNRTADLALPDTPALLRMLDSLGDDIVGTGWTDHTIELLRLAQDAAENTPLGTPAGDPFLTITCPNCGHTWTRGSMMEPPKPPG